MQLPNFNLFQKNFASLVITPSRLYVVKLNGKKNKAEFFGYKDIPPGIIMGYCVKEKKALVELIKSLWKETKISDKFVGFIVPEFATYTKILDLPGLSDHEINEAITWQAQEYLPADIEEMVIDWKIIRKTKEGVRVLLVAILREMLTSYIDVVGEAGLSPLVVETPSLSLSRITKFVKGGKMVIFLNPPEALIVLADGDEIIASSVVSADSINVIVNTVLQIVSHYESVDLQKILVGGEGPTQEIVQNLHYNLGIDVKYIEHSVLGMKKQEIDRYLLAISLQYKNPAEPASQITINLLPPQWAETYKRKLNILKVWTITLLSSIIVWATFISVFLVMMVINYQVESFSQKSQTADKLEFNRLVSQIRANNQLSDKVLKIDEKNYSFSQIINSFYKDKPGGIQISRINLNLENGIILISGVAQTRQDLIDFKKTLDGRDDIQKVNLPLTNLIQESQIPFEFSTVYKDLKKEKKQMPKLSI